MMLKCFAILCGFIVAINLSAQKLAVCNYAVAPYSCSNHISIAYKNAAFTDTFSCKTKPDLIKWQKQLKGKLEDLLGLTKLMKQYKGYKPKAQLISSVDVDTYTRQKWYIWTEPDVPLPILVLIPKTSNHSLPLVITPHGHSKNTELYAGICNSEEEKKMIMEGERDVAVQAVNEGYIAIAPTTRGFGETRTEKDITNDNSYSCRDLFVHDIMMGRTPIGDRVWDMSRILDWAIENLPVDKSRIAITGNSGGGTISLFAGACDNRFSVVAPACYFSSFRVLTYINHCECNYIPGVLDLCDMSDIAGLIAPRSISIVAGEIDNIFPLAEVKKGFKKLQNIYQVAKSAENCQLYIGNGGHRFYKDGVWPFMKLRFAID